MEYTQKRIDPRKVGHVEHDSALHRMVRATHSQPEMPHERIAAPLRRKMV